MIFGIVRPSIGVRSSSDSMKPSRDPSAAKISDTAPLSTGLSVLMSGTDSAIEMMYPMPAHAPIASTAAMTPNPRRATLGAWAPRWRRRRFARWRRLMRGERETVWVWPGDGF